MVNVIDSDFCDLYKRMISVTASNIDDVLDIIANDNFINLTIQPKNHDINGFGSLLPCFPFLSFLQHLKIDVVLHVTFFRLNVNVNGNGEYSINFTISDVGNPCTF